MAYPTMPDYTINYLCFFPETGETQAEQLTDCYRQFAKNTQNKNYSKHSVLKQTIFISVADNSEYIQSKQKLLSCAKVFFGELPPTSILAQSPENESLAIEFTYIEGAQSEELIRKQNEEASWLVFERAETKMIFAAGLGSADATENILLQSDIAFGQLQCILKTENMEFSDIVRQWNYIEQITEITDENKSPSQHYQVFNDVRTKYYHLSRFKRGFPAATGIGTDFGGISIDFIAAKFKNEESVIAVKSPVQLDAYNYSQEVLAENNSMCDFCRTTPKFERAKIISTPESKWIFVSGTAAISGQASSNQQSAELQTEMTIQNILNLISVENIEKHGISGVKKTSFNYFRVYVKYKNDIQQVKDVCLKYFPQVPILYVVADICRPELLVEIEGQAQIN